MRQIAAGAQVPVPAALLGARHPVTMQPRAVFALPKPSPT